jgi:hypothetical protein
VDERIKVGQQLALADKKVLTDFATLHIGMAIDSSHGYTARELHGHRPSTNYKRYEVYHASAEAGPYRWVEWPQTSDEGVKKTCTCYEMLLEGLFCRHMMAVYRLRYTQQQQTPVHLLKMLEHNIAEFYWKKNYVQGYTMSVVRPDVTYLAKSSTMAPQPQKKKGPQELKRHLSWVEENTGKSSGSRATPRTEKNMETYDIQAQLDRDIGKRSTLRPQRAAGLVDMLMSAWGRLMGTDDS